MTSLHYRSASATDRRSTHVSNGPSRVNSTRARDYEGPSARDSGSPALSDGVNDHAEGTHRHSKSENRISGVERRREKSTVTTTETIFTTRRSPKKENSNIDNRKNDSSRRRSTASPVLKRPPKEEDAGVYSSLKLRNVANLLKHRGFPRFP